MTEYEEFIAGFLEVFEKNPKNLLNNQAQLTL